LLLDGPGGKGTPWNIPDTLEYRGVFPAPVVVGAGLDDIDGFIMVKLNDISHYTAYVHV